MPDGLAVVSSTIPIAAIASQPALAPYLQLRDALGDAPHPPILTTRGDAWKLGQGPVNLFLLWRSYVTILKMYPFRVHLCYPVLPLRQKMGHGNFLRPVSCRPHLFLVRLLLLLPWSCYSSHHISTTMKANTSFFWATTTLPWLFLRVRIHENIFTILLFVL